MKNRDKQNFTKLTQKKGISLIVLIVTIIVIIILAAVVILTISKNNPVGSAREARFKEDIRSFQDDLALTISKEYTDLQGQRDNKITESNFDSIKRYIPSFTEKYDGKLVIKNDELMYQETVTEIEKKWFEDLGIKVRPIDAQTVAESPTEFYGKSITNYDVNGVKDWKIFYSDEKNMYLIASDYVPVSTLPTTSLGNKPVNENSLFSASFTNVINDYTGSADITDPKIQALNSDYFNKGYTSIENNMKAEAYMLDTKIWSCFADASITEYAIGGPTVELFMTSYNQSHNVDYRTRAIYNNANGQTGYQISKDGGINWVFYSDGMINSKDRLYVINNTTKASGMWLASTSAVNPSFLLCIFYCYDRVFFYSYENYSFGFRPLVCLKSNIQFEADGDGYKIK